MNTTIYKIDIFDFLFKFCVLVNSKINCLPLWKSPLQWLRIKKTPKRQLLKWQRKASCIISFSFIITYIKNKNNLKNKENLFLGQNRWRRRIRRRLRVVGQDARNWSFLWNWTKYYSFMCFSNFLQHTLLLHFLYFFANGTLTFLYRDDGRATFNLFNIK